jgi:fructose-bisphosphate aldolase class I
MGSYISGVILFDETIRQSNSAGEKLVDIIKKSGALPGIKVDMGAKSLAKMQDETVTEGLDGLRERLQEYSELGAKFAKWRAVISISEKNPSHLCIDANAHALARYAALCQESEIVPIVEPEVLMDGSHSIQKCYDVTKKTLLKVFDNLLLHNVDLKGICLKPNMIIGGSENSQRSTSKEIAQMTVDCFKECVPEEVPGIVFLSGGQSEIEATENLNEINKIENTPWKLSFSYGRALQSSALKAWQGKLENEDLCSKAFTHRAKMNSLASEGSWSSQQEG